jgi:hypothetical protein
MRISKLVAALSVSGAVVLGISAPAHAAPMTPLSAAATPAARAGNAVQVRFGGGFRGGFGGFRGGFGGWRGGYGWGGAALAGAVIGGALAAPYYYGSPYYGYGYGYPYGYSRVVVAPGYGYYGGYPYYRRAYGYYGW